MKVPFWRSVILTGQVTLTGTMYVGQHHGSVESRQRARNSQRSHSVVVELKWLLRYLGLAKE